MFELTDLASVAAQNDEATVRAEALDTNYADIDVREATLRIARLMLLREPGYAHAEVEVPNLDDTPIERLADRLRSEDQGYRAVILANWVTTQQGLLPDYALYLYNADYGASRAILEYVLTGEKWAPPYLKLVLLNMLRQVVGLSHDQLHELTSAPFGKLAPWVNRLLRDDAALTWMRERKRKSIRFYGGVTNTVLGLYDGIFADADTGTDAIVRTSERRFDLGGGFGTSELERLLGCRLVSADLLSPRLRDYDEELIILDVSKDPRSPVANSAVRREFFARQDQIEHLHFDVFKDGFPTDASSYTITSTGFMTSTLRPTGGGLGEIKGARLGTISTSVHAILRVVELAALGKSVDLFTIQRATGRVYRYKTCLLQWREGRLANLVTTVDPRAAKWAKGFEHVSGLKRDGSRFAELMQLPPAEFASL